MKYCKECGKAFADEARFCGNCGGRLEESVQETTQETVLQEAEFVEESTKSGSFIQRLNKKIVIGIIAIVCVIVLAITMVPTFIIGSNPTYRTLVGFKKLLESNEVKATGNFNISSDDDYIPSQFLSETDHEVGFTFNKKNLTFDMIYTQAYEGTELGSFVLSFDGETMYFDYPDLIDKDDYMYMELDIDTDEGKDLEKYINMIDYKKLDMKYYAKAIEKGLGNDIKKSGSKVIINMDMDTLFDVLEEVLDAAEDDKKLQEFISDNAVKILSKMLKDDFEFMDLDEDILEEMEEYFEDDFEDDFEDGLEMMKDGLEYAKYGYEGDFDLEIVIDFSFFNKIKSIDMVLEVDDGYSEYEFEAALDFTKGFKAGSYDTKDGIDVIKDYDKIEDIYYTIIDELEDIDDDDLEDLLDDLSDDGYWEPEEILGESLLIEILRSIYDIHYTY